MRRYIIFTIAVLATSCKISLRYNSDYLYTLKHFNDTLVSHFPKEGIYESFSFEVDTFAYYNTVSLMATIGLSKEQFEKIHSKYKDKLIKNDDSRIVVVNSFLDNHNFPTPRTVFCGESCLNKTVLKAPFYIMPNFYSNDNQDSTTVTKLSPQFEHIVLEQKEGIYSSKINPKLSTMPVNFFHGYSKGISMNKIENKVIYWTIVW